MIETIIVNDKKLPWLFIGEGFNIPSFNFTTESIDVPGRAGAIIKDRQLKPYDFTIPLVINNEWISQNMSHDDILNKLAEFFDYKNEVKLKISSQNWYWWAYFDGPIELPSIPLQFPTFEIKVILLDPYKYSDTTYKNTAISDSVTVVNSGTAETYPIVRAKALSDSTNFLISRNADDYFMVGQSENAFKKTKNTNPRVLYNHMDSMSGWSYLPSGTNTIIGDAGGVAMGRFRTTGKSSITIDESVAMTGSSWVGPVAKKSLTRSVQDFRAMVKMRINDEKVGVGKGYMYLYDERNQIVAAVGLVDASNTKYNVRAHFILYNDYGEPWEWVDYLGKGGNTYDTDYIYLQIERKGNRWAMKTWKYETDKKGKKYITGRMNKTFNDKARKYNNRIALAGVAGYKHVKYKLEQPYFALVSVEEILPDEDDIPILIKAGDELMIDMKQHLVTLNEVPVLKEKDFGSDFFAIESGITEMFVAPEGRFQTEVTWQDRYL